MTEKQRKRPRPRLTQRLVSARAHQRTYICKPAHTAHNNKLSNLRQQHFGLLSSLGTFGIRLLFNLSDLRSPGRVLCFQFGRLADGPSGTNSKQQLWHAWAMVAEATSVDIKSANTTGWLQTEVGSEK